MSLHRLESASLIGTTLTIYCALYYESGASEEARTPTPAEQTVEQLLTPLRQLCLWIVERSAAYGPIAAYGLTRPSRLCAASLYALVTSSAGPTLSLLMIAVLISYNLALVRFLQSLQEISQIRTCVFACDGLLAGRAAKPGGAVALSSIRIATPPIPTAACRQSSL